MVQTNSVSAKLMLLVLAMGLACSAQAHAGTYFDSAKLARDQFLTGSKKFFNFVAEPFRPIVEVPGAWLGSCFTLRQLQIGKIVFTTLGACIIKNAMARSIEEKDRMLDLADSSISTINSFQDGSFHGALKNIATGTLFKDPLTLGGTLCSLGGNLITAGKINNHVKSVSQAPAGSAADAAACANQAPSAEAGCCAGCRAQ